MNIFNVSLLTALSTATRMVSGFIINKTLAVYSGPIGIAMVGQLQNFNSILCTLSKGGINSGVVKYISEKKGINKKIKIISTSFYICTISSIILSSIMFISADYLSVNILDDLSYSYIFKVFSFTILFFSLNSILMSIINGLQQIKKYIIINIIGSLISLLITFILITYYNISGALLAIVINQSLIFFVTIFLFDKRVFLNLKLLCNNFCIHYCKKLFFFTIMTIVTAISVPLSQYIIRDYIKDNLSIIDAGIWQGMLYFSSTYLIFVTSTINVYYTPKISSLNNKLDIRNEIKKGFYTLIPIVCFLSIFIFYFRTFIISIIFTKEFISMQSLFKYYLLGDVIKIAAFLLSSIMLAKALTKVYIISEVVFSLSFVLFSIYFISKYGLIGTSYAYVTNYSLYLLFTIIYFRDYLWKTKVKSQ